MNSGAGSTEIIRFTDVPSQPLRDGVIVYVTFWVVVFELKRVWAGISLVLPEAVNPVTPAGAVADHVNVVPVKSEIKFISVVSVPEQMVSVRLELVMDGIGFTEKSSVSVVVPQLLVTLNDI